MVKVPLSCLNQDGEQVKAFLSDDRRLEIGDPVPVEPPVGITSGPTLSDTVRRMLYGALSERAAAEGFESAEEADDFMVDDDYDPSSPWEEQFDPVGFEPGAVGKALADRKAAMAAKPAAAGEGSGGGDPVRPASPKAAPEAPNLAGAAVKP